MATLLDAFKNGKEFKAAIRLTGLPATDRLALKTLKGKGLATVILVTQRPKSR